VLGQRPVGLNLTDQLSSQQKLLTKTDEARGRKQPVITFSSAGLRPENGGNFFEVILINLHLRWVQQSQRLISSVG
jgi:hypothetical protein